MSDAGLCSTCAHGPGCSLIKTGVAMVLNCEEFEPGEGLSGGGGRAQTPEGAAAKSTERANADDSLGLCVNCDLRETCSLAKPEGGVWHCEEYQAE